MSLSRSQSHQKEKAMQKRHNRRKLNLFMIGIGIILVSAGIVLTLQNSGKLSINLPFGGNDRQEDQVVVKDEGQDEGNQSLTDVPDPSSTNEHEDSSSNNDEEDSNGNESNQGESAGEKISLSFVGDLLPGEYVTPLIEQYGWDYPYLKSLLYLGEPDLLAGNLEMPFTLRGTPIEGTAKVYKGNPKALTGMKDVGFDIVNLANNHAMDQGVEGMVDTIQYLDEAGIAHMGTGNNDTEAFEPTIQERNGLKVAYIGLSQVIPYMELKADRNTPGIAETYETKRAIEAIQAAEQRADIVVVMVHWGETYADSPKELQQQYARLYIDAGADLVIGSHPQVLQGFEMYKGKWIAYSLGNFVFSAYPSGVHAESGVLDAVCEKSGQCELRFNPMIVIQGQPTPIEGEAASELLQKLSSLSFGVKVEEDGTIVALRE